MCPNKQWHHACLYFPFRNQFAFCSFSAWWPHTHKHTRRHLLGFHTEKIRMFFLFFYLHAFPKSSCLRSVTLKSFFFFLISVCVLVRCKEGVKMGEGMGLSTYRACVCVLKKKIAVTNMFVSMRQRETALSKLPHWVVYKKICHISQSLPPATLQHSTPCNSWLIMQCVSSLFLCLRLSESLALSLSICCCGVWEDFKHREEDAGRQKREEKKRNVCRKHLKAE